MAGADHPVPDGSLIIIPFKVKAGADGLVEKGINDRADTRPGKRLQFANLKMAIEIVSFPINSMVDLSIVMLLFTRGYPLVN